MDDDGFDERFNMSLRRFLKKVGVTSQQAIEEAVRAAGEDAPGRFAVTVTLSAPAIGLTHAVDGEIETKDDA
jgi:hypothetical protein